MYAPEGVEMKAWFDKTFGVKYLTVLRYTTFACIINRYPRLIVCGLSFSQVMKHQRRLVKYLNLKEHSELAEKLATTVILAAQKTAVYISPSDGCSILDGAFSVDPDYVNNDDNCDSSEDAADPEWEKWVQQECESRGIYGIIQGGGEQEEMEDTVAELCDKVQHELSTDESLSPPASSGKYLGSTTV